MFAALVFIIILDTEEAPSGDQVLRINMSSQKGGGGHRHFDSCAREPRLHLTPASHLLSRDATVLMQREARRCSRTGVYTCPTSASTQRSGDGREEPRKRLGKGAKKKKGKSMEISCGEAGVE